MASLFIEYHDGRIFQFAPQKRRNHAHDNARGHHEDECLKAGKRLLHCRAQPGKGMDGRSIPYRSHHLRHRQETLRQEKLGSFVKAGTHASGTKNALLGQGKNRRPHFEACRNICENSGA